MAGRVCVSAADKMALNRYYKGGCTQASKQASKQPASNTASRTRVIGQLPATVPVVTLTTQGFCNIMLVSIWSSSMRERRGEKHSKVCKRAKQGRPAVAGRQVRFSTAVKETHSNRHEIRRPKGEPLRTACTTRKPHYTRMQIIPSARHGGAIRAHVSSFIFSCCGQPGRCLFLRPPLSHNAVEGWKYKKLCVGTLPRWKIKKSAVKNKTWVWKGRFSKICQLQILFFDKLNIFLLLTDSNISSDEQVACTHVFYFYAPAVIFSVENKIIDAIIRIALTFFKHLKKIQT